MSPTISVRKSSPRVLSETRAIFAGFLDAAASSEGSAVNLSRLASEFGLCHHTVRACFDLLECTLVGGWVPGCHKHRKRRLRLGPKFYFSDVGTVDRLLRRGELSPGTEGFGQAFENSVLNEIGSFASHQEIDADVTHWRLPGGIDIGFVLGAMLLAIEVKCSERIANRHLKGLRTLAKEHPEARRGVVVCREATAWPTEDGIEGLPARTFATRLWRGELACLV